MNNTKNSEYLIAVDLEGIHGVVGVPYEKLSRGSAAWEEAREYAISEVNAAVSALFDTGAVRVAVWDNHGDGNNLDFSKIDERAERIDSSGDKYRFDFTKERAFSGIIYLGYHSREGTPGGVLAHTYSSSAIQYVRLDGADVGELDVDTYIATEYGIAPLFCASDYACIEQFSKLAPNAVTVITKRGHGRNRATLKSESEVIRELYDGVRYAVERDASPIFHKMPATLEVRYTRCELAEEIFERVSKSGEAPVSYGADSHILIFNISHPKQIPCFL